MMMMMMMMILRQNYYVFFSIMFPEKNVDKDEIISMTRAWDKEKNRVPDGNRAHDLPNTGRVLSPLRHENNDDFDIAVPSSMQDACDTRIQLIFN